MCEFYCTTECKYEAGYFTQKVCVDGTYDGIYVSYYNYYYCPKGYAKYSAPDYVGTWEDNSSERCEVNLEMDGIKYIVG